MGERIKGERVWEGCRERGGGKSRGRIGREQKVT